MDGERHTVERVALLDQAHEVLKGRVLDRDYRPGERLSIDALARELGFSSTPIREALGRLNAEGLVVAEVLCNHLHMPRLYAQRPQHTEATWAEHVTILGAIHAGQTDEAARAVHEHLASSRCRLLE